MADHPDCRVVVGVDGSPASLAALRWAAQAARERDATLCVVGVDPDVHDGTGPFFWGSSSREDRMTALEIATSAAIAEVLGPAPTQPIHRQLEQGRPGEILARVAEKAELLVIGSRRDADPDEPLRPVLRACIRHAMCPVVVVAESGVG